MKSRKGFTLVELMVVIVIIGIVLTLITGGISLGGREETATVTVADKYSEYEEDWGTTYFVDTDQGRFTAGRQVWSSMRVDYTYNIVINHSIFGGQVIKDASEVQ